MCGVGLRWTFKPTPQPGNFVKARICPTCGKRSKRPVKIHTYSTKITPALAIRLNKHGEVAYSTTIQTKRVSNETRLIHTCCSLVSVTVYGRVERTVWSKHTNGAVKDFFLIIFVPSLGKRHWATLETVDLVAATDYLIHNMPED